MEALIVDIENELRFISKEIDALKRKKEKLHAERDSENIDSHIKAIALTLHSIYTGYEKMLEMIIKGIDGDVPTALWITIPPCSRGQATPSLMSGLRSFRKRPILHLIY